MKKVFFGLAVAVVALSASAFTNAQTNSLFATAYITGVNGSNYTFSYSADDVECSTGPRPCQISEVGSYTLPTSGTLEVPISDVNNTQKISINSTQPNF